MCGCTENSVALMPRRSSTSLGCSVPRSLQCKRKHMPAPARSCLIKIGKLSRGLPCHGMMDITHMPWAIKTQQHPLPSSLTTSHQQPLATATSPRQTQTHQQRARKPAHPAQFQCAFTSAHCTHASIHTYEGPQSHGQKGTQLLSLAAATHSAAPSLIAHQCTLTHAYTTLSAPALRHASPASACPSTGAQRWAPTYLPTYRPTGRTQSCLPPQRTG